MERSRSAAISALLPLLAALAIGCSSNDSSTSGSGGSGGGSTLADGIPASHPPRQEPPAHVVGGFEIAIPSATLMPGEETYPCYIFPLDVTGPSRLVAGGKLTVGPGMHHGNITTRPKTGEGIRPCPADESDPFGGEADDILKGGAVLFGSSTQISGTEWQSFPEGMAYAVRDGFEIVARMHYLNATSAPLELAPEYEWFTVDPASVTQEIGPFAWTLHQFAIPPHTTQTVTATCGNFPAPMHLVTVLPHMHKLGKRFTGGFVGGKLDGKLFLDSPGYNPDKGVMVAYDAPGVDLGQGDGATYACTWNNTLDKTIVEGVGDNEMCILFGYAWPPEHAYTTTATEGGCLYIAPPAAP
jgi:hypothetical protein